MTSSLRAPKSEVVRWVAIATFLLALPWSALAAPGHLDTSFGGFGNNGRLVAPDFSQGLAVTPDGKVVTAGHSGGMIIVRRYLSNGLADPGFGAGGTAQISSPSPSSYTMGAAAVTIQGDGKIVVAGWADWADHDDILVLRLNATGTVDGSFGLGGIRTTDVALSDDRASAVLVQPDGKIIVAGTAHVGGDDDFVVLRYTTAGPLDPSFSSNGWVTVPFGEDDVCRDLTLQEDGKIVVVGDGADAPHDLCVARIHPDGTLDNGFDSDGKLSLDLGDYDFGYAVGVQSGGRIIVASHEALPDRGGTLLRFLPNGTLDNSFSFNGRLDLSVDGVWDLAIQPDDRIVIACGSTQPLGNLTLLRITSNGEKDLTFGEYIHFLDAVASSAQLRLLPDGRVVAKGTVANSTAIMRTWQDGTVNYGGVQTFALDESGIPPGTGFPPGSSERLKAMAIQPDGKIVVVGPAVHAFNGESDFACVRFLPDGQLDTSFGLNGHVTFSFHNLDDATAVAIQPDGKIVVAGFTGASAGANINFLVVRFLPNGALDNTFGFSGFNVIDFAAGPDYVSAIALAPDGKIVLAGTVFNGVDYVMGVARFTSDGVADASFDLDAKQLVSFAIGASHTGTCVLVQPDLKIVVGGEVGGDFALLRLNESGSLDDTFGCSGGIGGGDPCDGKARIDMGGIDYAYGLGRAPNGWLYLGGYRIAGPVVHFAIAQFSANGGLLSCPPFPCENWPNGKAYLNLGDLDTGFALDVRADGQVVIAGRSNEQFAWGQFNPTSQVAHVTEVTDLPGQEIALAVQFVGSDRLLVAGHQNVNGDFNFILAKYETTVGTVGVAEAVQPVVGAFEALGPNPTKAGSHVTFTLAQASVVEMRVHDVSGRLVRMERVGPLPAGRHRTLWDGRGADGSLPAAGVLFVSLRAEGREIGRRTLVVLR